MTNVHHIIFFNSQNIDSTHIFLKAAMFFFLQVKKDIAVTPNKKLIPSTDTITKETHLSCWQVLGTDLSHLPLLSTVFENGENNDPASCQDACSWPIHPAQWSSLHTVNLSHDYFVLCCWL